MARKQKKLRELLEQDTAVEECKRVVNDEIFNKLTEQLRAGKYIGDDEVYNPLLELAKVAMSPEEDAVLRVRCSSEIAQYMFPKVRSLEIKSTEDKNINVNITIAGYARSQPAIEIEAEELENEDEEDENREFRLSDFTKNETVPIKGKLDS
jgi:hypothetical protein